MCTCFYIGWQSLGMVRGALGSAWTAFPTFQNQSNNEEYKYCTCGASYCSSCHSRVWLPMVAIIFQRRITKRRFWRFWPLLWFLLSCWCRWRLRWRWRQRLRWSWRQSLRWSWRAPPSKWGRCMFETRLKLVSINPGMLTRKLIIYLARYEAKTHRDRQRGGGRGAKYSRIQYLSSGMDWNGPGT